MLTFLRISRNALFRLLAQFGTRLLSLTLVALITRREGPEGLGLYVLVLSVIAILTAIADLGLNTYLTRETPRTDLVEDQAIMLGDILLLKIGTSGITYLGLLVLVSILPFATHARNLLAIGGLLLITQALSGPLMATINGRQRMELTSSAQLAERVITLGGGFVLLRQGYGVQGVILLSVISSLLVGGAYVFILLKWDALPRFRWTRAWRRHIRQAYPFALTLGVAALYSRFDLILLNLLKGEIVTGWYGAAYKLQEAFGMLPASIMFALFPEMSRLASQRGGLRQLKILLDFGRWLMPLGGITFAIIGSLFSVNLLTFVYGGENVAESAVTAFRIMVWVFPVSFLSMLYGHALYALGHQLRVLRAIAIIFVASVSLNLILIPRWSLLGASVVTLLTEIGLGVLLFLEVRRSPIRSAPVRFPTGGPISARATFADLDGDGQPEIIVGSDALYAWRLNGNLLPGFPVRGGNAFASQPAIVDWNADGRLEIIVGSDDDALHAFRASGQSLPGWPRYTKGDVYSSPWTGDLDKDGRLEVLVGSDDGKVYAWREDGTFPAGWPQQTQGFVSASPALADIDADGHLEVLVGSWDHHVHIWRADGNPFPGWPQKTGHVLWSAPSIGDLDGDGRLEIVAASDQVYVWRSDGSLMNGWPQPTRSFCVASPTLADLTGDGKMEVIVASEMLYAWHWDGSLVPGFPADLKSYLWSPPILIENISPKLLIACWDGRLHVIDAHGDTRDTFTTHGPLFAAPSLLELENEQEQLIVIGSWDGNVYQFRYSGSSNINNSLLPNKRNGNEIPRVFEAGKFRQVSETQSTFISFPGPTSSRVVMYYKAQFEAEWHPVPMVVHKGLLTGLVQPFVAGTSVEYYAKGLVVKEPFRRFPNEGTFEFRVTANWPLRLKRKVKRIRSSL